MEKTFARFAGVDTSDAMIFTITPQGLRPTGVPHTISGSLPKKGRLTDRPPEHDLPDRRTEPHHRSRPNGPDEPPDHTRSPPVLVRRFRPGGRDDRFHEHERSFAYPGVQPDSVQGNVKGGDQFSDDGEDDGVCHRVGYAEEEDGDEEPPWDFG